jgi:hypothetical protein
MKIIYNIIRIAIGLLFLAIGVFHLYAYQYMAVYVPLPIGSKVFVLSVGATICVSSFGIILNKFVRISLIIIAVTLAFTGLMVLTPIIFRNPDEMLKMIELPNLYKLILSFGIFTYLVSTNSKQ